MPISLGHIERKCSLLKSKALSFEVKGPSYPVLSPQAALVITPRCLGPTGVYSFTTSRLKHKAGFSLKKLPERFKWGYEAPSKFEMCELESTTQLLKTHQLATCREQQHRRVLLPDCPCLPLAAKSRFDCCPRPRQPFHLFSLGVLGLCSNRHIG